MATWANRAGMPSQYLFSIPCIHPATRLGVVDASTCRLRAGQRRGSLARLRLLAPAPRRSVRTKALILFCAYPLALANAIPYRCCSQINSLSNSASAARTVSAILPDGWVWTVRTSFANGRCSAELPNAGTGNGSGYTNRRRPIGRRLFAPLAHASWNTSTNLRS